MLISLLFVSLTVFSQTDTTSNTKCFTIPVVKLIMKDLLIGDSAIANLKLTETQLLETEKKLSLKDSIINFYQFKEKNYLTIIDAEKQKFGIMEQYSKRIEIELKKEKVKNKFKSIVGVGVIAILTIFSIAK